MLALPEVDRLNIPGVNLYARGPRRRAAARAG
jgi:hypothetical protein